MLATKNNSARRLKAVVIALAGSIAVAACDTNGLSGPTSALTPGNETSNSSAFSRGDGVPSSANKRREVIKNPTRAQLLEKGPLEERALGNPNAKVTVIEYGSWTCPHCRAFRERTWPVFKREYIDTGKVHYILREFPIGRSSGNAALVTRCAPKKDYFKLYDLYLTNQEKWVSQDVRTDEIYAIAARTGMSRTAFDACMKNETLIKGVKWSKDRGRELGVIGTPTFFINEKQIRSFQTIEAMRSHIDPMLNGQIAVNSG